MKTILIGLLLSSLSLHNNSNIVGSPGLIVPQSKYPIFLNVYKTGSISTPSTFIPTVPSLGLIEMDNLKIKIKFATFSIWTIEFNQPFDYYNLKDRTRSSPVKGNFRQNQNNFSVEVVFYKESFKDYDKLQIIINQVNQTEQLFWYCQKIVTNKELTDLRDEIVDAEKNTPSIEKLFKDE